MNKRLIALVFMVVLVVSLTACGTSKQSNVGSVTSGFNSTEDAMAPSKSANELGYDAISNTVDGKKLVYSAHAQLESKNYDEDLNSINKLFITYGIIVDNSEEHDENSYWYQTSKRPNYINGRTFYANVRVHVTNFDQFLEALRGTSAHVTSLSVSSADMTKSYNDNENRIRSLNSQEQRLLQLLEKAENVSEMLEIDDRLTDVRYELKVLNDRNNSIDYDVEYSTVTIRLTEVVRYSDTEYGFIERVGDAISESWGNFVGVLKDGTIWFIFALPFIVLLAVVWIVFNLIRKACGKQPISVRKWLKGIRAKHLLIGLGIICLVVLLVILLGTII